MSNERLCTFLLIRELKTLSHISRFLKVVSGRYSIDSHITNISFLFRIRYDIWGLWIIKILVSHTWVVGQPIHFTLRHHSSPTNRVPLIRMGPCVTVLLQHKACRTSSISLNSFNPLVFKLATHKVLEAMQQ